MNLEIEQIEELLHRMRPRTLSAETSARIHNAVHEVRTQNPLHTALATTRPSPLPPELAKRLEESLSRIPHPGTGKVVHFPVRRERHSPPAWRKLSVAAAVALMGAASALLVPQNQTPSAPTLSQTSPGISSPAIHSAATSTPNAAALVPAGYRRGLSEAKDEGIVWQSHYGPHRRLKLVYRELVTLRDSSGRIYQVERPRTEYVLVPAKID